MKVSAIVLGVAIMVMGLPLAAQADTAVLEEGQKSVLVGNTICPVSGENIGTDEGMKPETYEYKGKVYNLCCLGCVGKFKADPEKYSQIADQEVMNMKAEDMDMPMGDMPMGHKM